MISIHHLEGPAILSPNRGPSLSHRSNVTIFHMDRDARSSFLKKTRLPRDWDVRYSKRLVQEYINYLWEEWPPFHSGCICQQGYVENMFRENADILDGSSPKELDLGSAYSFFNKTTILYLAYGGDIEVHWRINEPKFPVYWEKWLSDAYDTWAHDCKPRERQDARFVFALHQFSKRDDKRVQKWIGLGEEPSELLEMDEDIERLVKWHLRHCDKIEARAKADVSAHDEWTISGGWRAEGIALRAKAYHSALAPTCRAILAIGRSPMAESQHVLLVLTGHNQDMVSGALTFDSIPLEDSVARRSSSIVEVSLETAVKYLGVLERKEEYMNAAFRAKNDERREAIYANLRARAENELHDLRKFCGTTRGRRTRRGRKRSKRTVKLADNDGLFMDAAWRRIVDDEHALAFLSSTAELRRSMQDEGVELFPAGDSAEKSWWLVGSDMIRSIGFWGN